MADERAKCKPHGHVQPCAICDLSPLGGGPRPDPNNPYALTPERL